MSAAGDRLREMARRAADDGGRAAAAAMAEQAAAEIRADLGRRSHAPKTSTPSPPGSPPARVTGRLQGSVSAGSAARTGAYRWEAEAGSRGVIYAKVHTHGMIIRHRRAPFLVFTIDGITYRAKQVYIPPRPFIWPAVERLRDTGRTSQVSADAFRRAVHGGA